MKISASVLSVLSPKRSDFYKYLNENYLKKMYLSLLNANFN